MRRRSSVGQSARSTSVRSWVRAPSSLPNKKNAGFMSVFFLFLLFAWGRERAGSRRTKRTQATVHVSRPNATVLRLPPRRDSKAQPCGASPLGTLPRLRSGISRLRRFGSLRPITPKQKARQKCRAFCLVESGGVEPPCCERTEKPSTYLALT